MGTLLFGKDESITCIQHVDVKGAAQEPLCIAYKTSKLFVGAGIYLSDDGYVFGVEGNLKKFYKVDAAKIEELQTGGLVPRPLPPYSIAWHEYAFGYSLWIIIAVCLVSWRIGEYRRKKRIADDAATPTSLGPPAIVTKIDRFVEEQTRQVIKRGERVQHQAYTLNEPPGVTLGVSAFYVVLTNRRLLFFKARVGAWGPLAENRETEAIERSSVVRVFVEENALRLCMADGSSRYLFIPMTSKLSNQRAFYRDVPRLLPDEAPAPAAPADAPAADTAAAPAEPAEAPPPEVLP